MSRILLALCLCLSACVSEPPAPQATSRETAAAPAPAPTRGPATRSIPLENGLVVDVPASWTLGSGGIVNRATHRLLIAGNGDLSGLPTIPGNGDYDAAALPSGRVIVAVQWFCRLSCMGPETETTLPLDWSTATPLASRVLPADRHEHALPFRWFDLPMFLIGRWADDAPAADVAALAAIARSVRAEPATPAGGEYRGWAGVGPLAAIPIGMVRLEPLPAGAIVRPAYRTVDNGPFFVVRGRQNVYAFASRPLADQRCEIRYDAASDRFTCSIEARTYEWTRFGRYLGAEPSSDLAQHRVIVRDGLVWVHYAVSARLTPPVRDEAAER